MRLIVDIAIPAVVVLLMVVVGLDLTPHDFRRVVERPKAVIVGILGQLTILPLITLVLIRVLDPPPFLVAGMIVLAACPGGVMSNLYTYLAIATIVTVAILGRLDFLVFATAFFLIQIPMILMALALSTAVGLAAAPRFIDNPRNPLPSPNSPVHSAVMRSSFGPRQTSSARNTKVWSIWTARPECSWGSSVPRPIPDESCTLRIDPAGTARTASRAQAGCSTVSSEHTGPSNGWSSRPTDVSTRR